MKRNAVEAILQQKIDEAIDILSRSDRKKMSEVKKINDFSAKFSAFCDCLIDAANSQREKADAPAKPHRNIGLCGMDESGSETEYDTDADNNDPLSSFDRCDYEEALTLLGCREGELATAVSDQIQVNSRLQRLHNQDRVIMLKQQKEITNLKSAHKNSGYNYIDSYECDEEDDKANSLKEEIHQMYHEINEIQRNIKKSRHKKNFS